MRTISSHYAKSATKKNTARGEGEHMTNETHGIAKEDRENMIQTLSFMSGKGEGYFEDMDDRRLIEEYDRYTRL